MYARTTVHKHTHASIIQNTLSNKIKSDYNITFFALMMAATLTLSKTNNSHTNSKHTDTMIQ